MASRTEATNFIRHLLKIREIFIKDDRLSPLHISLYFALFFEWNDNRFQSPFFIDRSEMMNASKIGSANTYLKCLKDLNSFGYIDYLPSHNPMKGSRVNLYKFDTTTGTTTNTTSNTTAVQVVIPFNKHIKDGKHKKDNKGSKSELPFASGDDLKIVQPSKSENQNLNRSLSDFDQKISSGVEIPSMDEVKIFFIEKEKSDLEAEKFFNHFESNGWLVGGKTKMKNWQAAARNWMARSEEFNSDRFLSSSKDRLNVNQNKDYSVPL